MKGQKRGKTKKGLNDRSQDDDRVDWASKSAEKNPHPQHMDHSKIPLAHEDSAYKMIAEANSSPKENGGTSEDERLLYSPELLTPHKLEEIAEQMNELNLKRKVLVLEEETVIEETTKRNGIVSVETTETIVKQTVVMEHHKTDESVQDTDTDTVRTPPAELQASAPVHDVPVPPLPVLTDVSGLTGSGIQPNPPVSAVLADPVLTGLNPQPVRPSNAGPDHLALASPTSKTDTTLSLPDLPAPLAQSSQTAPGPAPARPEPIDLSVVPTHPRKSSATAGDTKAESSGGQSRETSPPSPTDAYQSRVYRSLYYSFLNATVTSLFFLRSNRIV